MENRYQYAKTDGHLDWHAGWKSYENFWEPVHDLLRFHRGDKFRIIERPSGHENPLRTLGELKAAVHDRLDHEKPDSLFDLRSEKDGYKVAVRRHQTETGGDRVVLHAMSRRDTPYIFGATDCSWLSMTCYAPEIDGPPWVHNAHAQHEMFGSRQGYVKIDRSKIKTGDLLFHHNDEHVSIFLDHVDGGRVWDTEPHSATGPPGWGYLAPGVRIRPMASGYYCDWEHVGGIGRVVEVNGKP